MRDLTVEERSRIEGEEDLVLDTQFLLQDRMAKLGVTRADLARRAGISKARVTQILQPGANPTIRNMARLFHALGEEIRLVEKETYVAHEASCSSAEEKFAELDWAEILLDDVMTFSRGGSTEVVASLLQTATPWRESNETANDNIDITYGRMAVAL